MQLILKDQIKLIDVRAPIEFKEGALPYSINLPILLDDEREIVGKTYKDKGNQVAIDVGHSIVNEDKKVKRVNQWLDLIQKNPKAQLYCARGGLRSEIAQAWLKEAGCDIKTISGGFKALRNTCLSILNDASNDDKKWMILSGRTGSAKTKLINILDNSICLEGLANHRGSAFGSFDTPQPTPINFENTLACEYLQIADKTVYFEDESRTIGRLVIPENFYKKMSSSKIILVEEPIENRIQNIYEEYVKNDKDGKTSNIQSDELRLKLSRISKRLGGDNYKKVDILIKSAFDNNDKKIHFEWIEILLTNYYDKMYDYQLEKKINRCEYSGTWISVKKYLISRK
ncbi:tRNA 2-selenouridine(34) synthase MnmH [Candidatus Marinimicrobia bacterium]|nr:tRNA 2-selenouridine(34) synthase MnmH [Candidatus Neomarinimicrobiota bacterium]